MEKAQIKAVRTGDVISVAVEGGFIRRPVPSDGLVVSAPDRDLFIATNDVLKALAELGIYPRQ